MKIRFKKGEGIITITEISDGIEIKYSCIDDLSKKKFTTDDIMEILGYKVAK